MSLNYNALQTWGLVLLSVSVSSFAEMTQIKMSQPTAIKLDFLINAGQRHFMTIHKSMYIILDVKAIHFVRSENRFLGSVVNYFIEDDIQLSRHYSSILWISSHCESFSTATNSISNKQAIFTMNKVLYQRQGYVIKNFLLSGFVITHMFESVLGFLIN
jgi:hypothetical protein